MAKELTLEELASGAVNKAPEKQEPAEEKIVNTEESIKDAKEVSISDLSKNLPGKENKEDEDIKDPEYISNAFDSMINTIQKKKDFIENEVMPIVEENAREIALENEINGEEVEDETSIDEENIDNVETKEIVEENNIDDETEDLDELLKELEDSTDELTVDETDDEETIEETRERFKESLSDIKVTSTDIDVSKIKIRQQPISASSVLNTIEQNKTSKAADWALFNTGRSIRVSECSGPELDALRKTMANSNELNSVIAFLKIVYDHIIDANKPQFEAWTKQIRTEDIESLYYALYKACYSDVNLIGRTCDSEDGGCDKTSIIRTDINKMVKFADDETKAKFNEILRQDTTTSSNTVESKIIAISDDIAISYTEPTLYTTFIQFSTLKPEITRKYSDLLNTMAYINGFFKIDVDENGEMCLTPIQVKSYPNNLNKTILSKLKVYSDILKTLNNDQYNILTAKLNNLITEPKVTYIYPEDTCPECGSTLPEEEIDSMLNVLFTRAQLAQIKSL